MKYWLYEDRRLSGPFEADAVFKMPGVSRATLVCPADRDGRAAADWQPVRCVTELRALEPAGLGSGPGFGPPEEESEAELDGVKRSMASLEMRLRALQSEGTREWVLSQSRALRSGLADLKETIAAQDARSDSIEAALAGARKSVDEMRAQLDAIVDRRARAERDLSGEFAELRKDLAAFGSSQEALKDRFEGGLATLQNISENLDPRIAALEERLARSESGISARLAALQAAVEGAELEPLREKAVARLTEALERLGKTVSLVQSRMVGLEERQDRTDPLPERIDALRVSLVNLAGQVSEVERAQAELRASAARWGEAHASVEAMRADLGRALREVSQSPVLQALEGLLKSAADRLASLEAGGREVAKRLEALDASEKRRVARARELERRRSPAAAAPAEAAAPAVGAALSPRWRDAALALGGVVLGLLVGLAGSRLRTAPGGNAASSTARDAGSAPAAAAPAPAVPPRVVEPGPPASAAAPGPMSPASPAAPTASPPEPEPPAAAVPPAEPKPEPPAEPRARDAGRVRPPRGSVRPAAGKVVGASLRPDGIELLFEGSIPEPRVDLRLSPPRLVLDLPGATTNLSSDSLGSLAPHIMDARLLPIPGGVSGVRVEVLLDKAANYRVGRSKGVMRVQFAFEDRARPQPAPTPTPPPSPAPLPRAPTGGESRLLAANVARDGVTLNFSSGVEPVSELLASPPRLVLDFPGVRNGLWTDEIGAWPPHIREVRLEAPEPGPRLRVTIYLDAPANYRVTRKGTQVLVRFLF